MSNSENLKNDKEKAEILLKSSEILHILKSDELLGFIELNKNYAYSPIISGKKINELEQKFIQLIGLLKFNIHPIHNVVFINHLTKCIECGDFSLLGH